MAYGSTEDEAIRKVKAISLQVLADMIESGEDVPGHLRPLARPPTSIAIGDGERH
jgi:hypothetical protein